MCENTTVIVNPTGLHARPASDFVKAAAIYKSKVTITNLDSGASANAKSMVMLLTLGLSCGTKVKIAATGEDEEVAVGNLISYLNEGCGEAI